MSLKDKTIKGLTWSFIDSFINQGFQFIVGIILARILTPKEFGLIGMLTIFIAISQSFIDSGFTQALIRKLNVTQADYSTVFYFNLVVSIICFFILYGSSGFISLFFNEPQLAILLQVLGLSLIINALSIIQKAILTKKLDFKLQTKISLISSFGSGFLAITLAYTGFGVWSLVIKTISGFFLTTLFLWLWNKWKPSLVLSMVSFKELFSFGSKLLLSGLINTIYQNAYYFIIGKYFSAIDLGYYTRADQFHQLPSANLTSVIQRVSYPVLSSIQDDKDRLKEAYKKIIKITMLFSFVLMLGMAATAKPMILTLIGDKWLPAVIYLQLLCFVGMFYPLHALNLNMLNVQGRSDLFLRLEIIKKIIAIPVILIGVFLGIKEMILAMIVNTIIAYYLNSYWSGKFIGYSFLQQIKDILPSFIIGFVVSLVLFTETLFMNIPPSGLFVLQIITGVVFTILLCELFKLSEYCYIKEILIEKLSKVKLSYNG
jgi:O-antigen/teichoic acid export membrane protein